MNTNFNCEHFLASSYSYSKFCALHILPAALILKFSVRDMCNHMIESVTEFETNIHSKTTVQSTDFRIKQLKDINDFQIAFCLHLTAFKLICFMKKRFRINV